MVRALFARGCTSGIGAPDDLPLVLLVRCGMSHRRPNPANRIQPGDMLVIDFSARYHGYTSDIARTMYFLKPDEAHAPAEVTRAVDAAIRAVGAVLAVIKPGMKGYEVDAYGRQSILDSGYPNIPHSVGHQVGLECHDGGTVLGPHRDRKAMTTAGGISSISQVAGLACLQSYPWVDAFIAHLTANRDYALERIRNMPLIHARKPDATYLLYIDISELGVPAETFTDFLKANAGLALVPGGEKFFGPGSEGHMRLCFATSRAILTQGLTRLEDGLQQWLQRKS